MFRGLYIFILSIFVLSACATQTGYYTNLNKLVGEGRYSEAVALAETSKMKEYGEKNALLFYLDKGMLLHYSGNYEESNIAFEKAKKLAEEYFTKSVTTELSTLLVSDNMRPYYGEDFERALINVFSALNYVFLKKENDALIEARQVDHFLKTLKVNYGRKSVFTEDAFARYITGMLYENQGQVNDAYISYVQAIEAYENYKKYYNMPVPVDLVGDALRTGLKLGFKEEVKQFKEKYKYDGRTAYEANEGELVVVHYNGIAPVKIDSFFEISVGKGWIYVESMDVKGEEASQVEQARSMIRSVASQDQVRIAFPKYAHEKYEIKGMEISASGLTSNGVLVENIGSIAIQNLDDRIARVRARAIARGVIKFVLAQKISNKIQENNNSEALGWIAKTALKAVSSATEKADKRCWGALPDTVEIARLVVNEGTHNIEINFKNGGGAVVSHQTISNITVKKGKKTFVAVRTAI